MKKNFKIKSHFVAGLVGVLLAVVLLGLNAQGHFLGNNHSVNSQESLMEFESVITDIVQETQGSVVSVLNFQSYANDPFSSFIMGQQGLEIKDIEQEPILAGTGSGVIYKLEGDEAFVVTNNHVIEGAESIEISLADGTTKEAELIGADQLSDLAVLKVSSEGIESAIEFADSDQAQVGQLAIAIGSPIGLGFSSSVTQGIISGLDRSLEVDTDGDRVNDWEMTLMQTDAAINPGNSGGALVNSQGQLLGINSIKYASAQIEGMGFAIPSNDVQMIIEQLERDGEVIRPKLGVATYDLNRFKESTRVEDLGLEPDMTDGALVAQVVPNSTAEKAGIQVLDIITALGEDPIVHSRDLKKYLYKHQVGDVVEMTIIRDGEEMALEVTLEAEPKN